MLYVANVTRFHHTINYRVSIGKNADGAETFSKTCGIQQVPALQVTRLEFSSDDEELSFINHIERYGAFEYGDAESRSLNKLKHKVTLIWSHERMSGDHLREFFQERNVDLDQDSKDKLAVTAAANKALLEDLESSSGISTNTDFDLTVERKQGRAKGDVDPNQVNKKEILSVKTDGITVRK